MPSDLLPTRRELLLRRTLYNPDGANSVASRRRRLIPILTAAALTLLWLLGAFSSSTKHPITLLLRNAKLKHDAAVAARPKSLREAYTAYVQLNGRLPPRGFDDWYAMTLRIEACRLGGFREMSDSLKVWWALEPREIRARLEALGEENHKKMGWVRVRDGHVHNWPEMVDKGFPTGIEDQVRHKGSRSAFEEMLQEVERFGGKLPDVDMFINNMDEPSVIIPYELRSGLESTARQNRTRKYQPPEKVRIAPTDAYAVKKWYASEAPDALFKVAHYQNKTIPPPARSVWSIIRAACPPTSLARTLPPTPSLIKSPLISSQYTSPFTTPSVAGEAGFITDHELERRSWCDQPDLQDLNALFVRPLSFPWTDQLLPVFGNSKIAGFNDIVIPPWYYWYGDRRYEDIDDPQWKDKADNLFWRGSNTGGWAYGLEWLGWLRTRAIQLTNPHKSSPSAPIPVLLDKSGPRHATLDRRALASSLTNAACTHPDQGDPRSTTAQRADPSMHFGASVGFHKNYFSKLVLDMDGTAYSGRYMALLASRSAVLKARMFIEVFDEALIPWFHYIPLSYRLGELYSILGYFFGVKGVAGAREAGVKGAKGHDEELRKIGRQGADWAWKCARREDAISYSYLLALEWGRLQSDQRAEMNFVM